VTWTPALFSPGDTLTAEELNTMLSGPYWQLRASAAQTIGNSANTPLSFNTVVEYNSRYSTISTPATSIAVPVDGLYLAVGTATFAANATGTRQTWLTLGGADLGGSVDPAPASGVWSRQVSALKRLSATDTVVLNVFQTSGGDLATSASTFGGCQLSVRWLGLG
jgi:hypothetical protein